MIRRPRVPAPGAWWRGIDTYAKRRLAVLVAACAIAGVAVLVALVVASGGEPKSPARLVPADALAYVEVNIDPSSAAGRGAAGLAKALPTLSDQVVSRLASGLRAFAAAGLAPGGKRAGWLGDDAAVALLAGPRPAPVELLAVSGEEAANAFAERLTGDRSGTRYRGALVRTGRRGSAAITHGFLVYGPTRLVKVMVDTAAGDGHSLASDANYSAATADLPRDSLALAYLSASGANTLRSSSLALLRPLASGAAVRGVALAVNAAADDLEVTARSAFHPGAGGAPPLAGLHEFTPRLPERLPADSLAYAGVGTAGAALKRSLGGLGGLGGAVSTAFLALVPDQSPKALRRLLPLLGAETAVIIQSGPGTSPSAPKPPHAGLVSIRVDPKKVKAALARAPRERPARRVDGTTLLVAGDAAEVKRLAKPRGSLDTTAGFSNAMVDFSTEPTLQAYLDLKSLVPLFEAAGLAENPAYASFAPEIRRLRALGLVVSSDPGSVTVQARLTVGG